MSLISRRRNKMELEFLKSLDYNLIGCSIGIVSFVYAIMRNMKADIKQDFESRFAIFDKRMDSFDRRLNSMQEQMFLLSTGKTLAQAILEEKMKNNN